MWRALVCSSQGTVQGIVLKAARHWGSNLSVVNDPLGEPGRTTFYVGLQSTWGDHIFSPCFKGDLRKWGLRETRMNE